MGEVCDIAWLTPFVASLKFLRKERHVKNKIPFEGTICYRTAETGRGIGILVLLKYKQVMENGGAQVRLKLGTDQPVALGDFVGNFVGLGNQFEKFLARDHPDLRADTEFFIQEVRNGCIEADLVAWVFGPSVALGAAGATAKWAIEKIDQGQILADFVSGIKRQISPYFSKGGRNPKASKSDLNDWLKTTRAIARDPKGHAKLEAATYEDGERKVTAEFHFSSAQAQVAEAELLEHAKEMEISTHEPEERVLLQFVRPSIESGKPGKKGGERGVIESLAKRALPVLYGSNLPEERMRHEKIALEGNIFRALFQVSVNVERNSAGRPVAYNITEVHGVIDDAEEDLLSDQ